MTRGAERAAIAVRARRRARRSQAGFTLMETIVAVLLASTVVLALAGGVFTMLRTTRVVSAAQRDQAALTTATETIKAAPFQECAGVATYAGGLPTGVTVVSVEHLDGVPSGPGLGDFVAAGAPSSPCPARPADDRVQRVTIRVASGGTAQIVLRAEPVAVP